MVGMQRMVAAGHLLHKSRGGHVPRGVAAGIGGGAQTAGGEGGGVRLAHDELLAGELQQGLAGRRDAVIKESCFSAVMPVSGWNQWV